MDAVKDTSKFVQSLLLKLTVGVMVGLVWLGQAGDKNEDIFTTEGAMFVCCFRCGVLLLLLLLLLLL